MKRQTDMHSTEKTREGKGYDTLFPHQREGVDFLIEKGRGILADEMGIGKTRQAIYASEGRTIIVCPASVKYGWVRELQGTISGNIFVHDSTKTDHVSSGDREWHIVNYDIIGKERIRSILAEGDIRTLILDEAHMVKSPKSKRSKEVEKLAKEATRVYLLTGTPVLNRPMDLFNLLKIIGHPLGKNWYVYAVRYCSAFRQTLRDGRTFWNVKGASNLDDLKHKTSGVMLRRTKSVLGESLPPKMRTEIPIELSKSDMEEYELAFENYIDYLMSIPPEELEKDLQNIMASRHIVELQKMRLIASRAKAEHIAKDALNAIEQGEKVVIFSVFSETLSRVRRIIKSSNVKVTGIEGQNTQEERMRAIDSFQNDPSMMAFIGNMKAAGLGITLSSSSIAMFCDADWTPAINEQAEDRIHRIGQNRMANIYYYIAKGTVEEDVMDLLQKKRQVIGKIMEGAEGRSRESGFAPDIIRRMAQKSGIA